MDNWLKTHSTDISAQYLKFTGPLGRVKDRVSSQGSIRAIQGKNQGQLGSDWQPRGSRGVGSAPQAAGGGGAGNPGMNR